MKKEPEKDADTKRAEILAAKQQLQQEYCDSLRKHKADPASPVIDHSKKIHELTLKLAEFFVINNNTDQ